MKAPRYWRPLKPVGVATEPASEELIAATMKHYQCDREAALRKIDEDERTIVGYWVNDLYQVQVRRDIDIESSLHLNIRRIDGAPIHDWRHLQQIKNEIVGPECEAVELYPAESRLVDTSNKYHLWASTDPTFRFPFGWSQRDVQDGDYSPKTAGLRQRPL